MRVLVTDAADFIVAGLVFRLLAQGERIVGIDDHNGCYNPATKLFRLDRFEVWENYTHVPIDISNQ